MVVITNRVAPITAVRGEAAQGSGQGQPVAQLSNEPPHQTRTIQLGQSTDEVTNALGRPDKVVNLGRKQIYVYKDLKGTFVKGEVADGQ